MHAGTRTTSLQPKKTRQKYFVAREIQLSIALLVVLAMLGAIGLQSLSERLVTSYALETPLYGVAIMTGYISIVVSLVFVFTNRFVGPFSRLEKEISLYRVGERKLRLSVRSGDDLHIRRFVDVVNGLVKSFEEGISRRDARTLSARRRTYLLLAEYATEKGEPSPREGQDGRDGPGYREKLVRELQTLGAELDGK